MGEVVLSPVFFFFFFFFSLLLLLADAPFHGLLARVDIPFARNEVGVSSFLSFAHARLSNRVVSSVWAFSLVRKGGASHRRPITLACPLFLSFCTASRTSRRRRKRGSGRRAEALPEGGITITTSTTTTTRSFLEIGRRDICGEPRVEVSGSAGRTHREHRTPPAAPIRQRRTRTTG